MFPLWGEGSTHGKGLCIVLDPPHPLIAKNNLNISPRLVLTPPPPPLLWASAWAWVGGIPWHVRH